MRKYILIIVTILLLTGCSNEPVIINEANDQVIDTNEAITHDNTIQDDVEVISQEPIHIRVLGEILNVRDNSDENSEVIGTVKENDIFLVQDEFMDDQNRVWYKIDSKDRWIAGWFCKEIIVSDVINENSYACINIESETADVFESYSKNNKVYDVNRGSKYKVIDTYFDLDNNQWYKIIDKMGTFSWLSGNDCSEYLSSETKKTKVTKTINNLLKDIQYNGNIENIIDDFSQDNISVRLDCLVTVEDTQIFTVVYDELNYLCLIDNSNAIGQIISSNDYYKPLEMVLNDYVILEHLSNNQITYKILNLKSTDTFEQALEIHSATFYRNSKEDTLIYEEDRIDETTGLSVEHLTDLKYYNISTNESLIYKRASSKYDWEIEVSDSESDVLKIIRVDWKDGSIVQKIELMDYYLYYYNSFEESKPYLEFGDIDEHLSSLTDEPSEENIISHMMGLEEITLYTTIELLNQFETKTHLYFDLSYHPREVWGEEYLLVSWEKNNKTGAEIVNRTSFGNFEEYMAVTLEDASKTNIIEYMEKIPLNFYDTRIEYLESYETDQFMFFSISRIDSGGPEEYIRILFWEKDNINGGRAAEKNTMGISSIIKENLLITTLEDFMTFYEFYNLSRYASDEFYIGTIIANQYKQLGDSDWIILETAHSNGSNTWSLPFVTEIDFLNIQSGERKKYLSSDESFDWVYTFDEENKELTIIKKERKKKVTEGEHAVYEVINFDQLDEFILKIEAL